MSTGWYLDELWIYWHRNWVLKKSSLSQVFSPKFQPIGDLIKTGIQKVEFKSSFCTQISFSWMISGWIMNILTQKLEFKKLSLIQVFSPRFYPVCDLVKTGIKKIEFKLCNQISPSWWLDFKSGVKVKFKWSSKVEFWNPSF